LAQVDILFKGVPRKYTRGYTADMIKTIKPKKVIIPCIGSFSLAGTAVDAGMDPKDIHGCDVSLYSHVLGNCFSGNDFELKAINEMDWLNQYMIDPVGKAASVILGIRILQYIDKKKSVWRDHRIRELRERSDHHISKARQIIQEKSELFSGLHYKTRDMWDLMDEWKDDPDVLMLVNPPRYNGGYEKMYRGVDEAFSWDDPEILQFTEDEYIPLTDYLGGAAATAVIYTATPVHTAEDPAIEWGDPWISVFADRPRSGKKVAINWIVSNKDPNVRTKLNRADAPRDRHLKKYKMFTEDLITEDSVIELRREKKEVVDYYRSLLVHRLPMAFSDAYSIILLDGQLLAVSGTVLAPIYGASVGQVTTPTISFCFSPMHNHYARIQKLALLSLTSSWWWTALINHDFYSNPEKFYTSMLIDYPEVKTARGILKVQRREELKQVKATEHIRGYKYELTYEGYVKERTPQETISEWIKRWGNQLRK
jgi:hypothetical protein